MEYTLSHQLIQNFNDTIQDIKHNEILLKSKILTLSHLAKQDAIDVDILFATDLLNQLLLLYNIILNILQDIENSLTFCKLNALHPSIIKPNELFNELYKISYYYPNKLPFSLKHENILDFESIIKVNCKVDANQIMYFLSVPIDYDTEFELYYMLPIPTKHNSEFSIINPNTKYLLKSIKDNSIKPLNNKCTKGKVYHCPSQSQVNYKATCEEQILLFDNSSQCSFNKLEITHNHIELIPEINQYLAVCPQAETIKIKCQDQLESKTLFGIYLLKEESCKIYFHEEALSFKDATQGQPQLIQLTTPFHRIVKPEMTIKLRNLQLHDIPINQFTPIIDEQPVTLHVPSVWTVLLYLSIISGAIFLLWKKRHRLSSHKIEKSSSAAPQPGARVINLPEEASF